mgnify:FL=1
MNFEEKLIRYIASKLIQRKFFLTRGEFPDPKRLEKMINQVILQLKEEYQELYLVRTKSEEGIITPAIKSIVDNLKIKK